jgi:hypothetical protein
LLGSGDRTWQQWVVLQCRISGADLNVSNKGERLVCRKFDRRSSAVLLFPPVLRRTS